MMSISVRMMIKRWLTRSFLLSLSKKKIVIFLTLLLCLSCSEIPEQDKYGADSSPYKILKSHKPELVVKLLHGSPIITMTVSGNGKFLATSSWDNTIRLWDIKNGRQIRKFSNQGQNEGISTLALALSHDGKTLFSGGSDHVIYQWSTVTGKIETEYLGHSDIIKSITLSPDEKKIISGGFDKSIKVWPVKHDVKHSTQNKILQRTSGIIKKIQFTPDGQSIIVISKNKAMLIGLDAHDVSKIFPEHPAGISASAISRDGKYLLTGDMDNNIWLSHIKTQKIIHKFTGHSDNITALDFSPDARQFVSSSKDHSIRIWDLNTNKIIQSAQFNQKDRIETILYIDNNTVLFNKSEALSIYKIDLNQEEKRFANKSKWVSSLAMSDSGRYLITGSWDHSAYLWDLQSGMMIHHLKGHKDEVRSVAFSPNNTMAATAARDGVTIVWNVRTGSILRTIKRSEKGVKTIAFSPDNKQLILGDDDGVLWMFSLSGDSPSDSELWHRKFSNRIEAVAYTPGAQSFISANGSDLSLRETHNGELIHRFQGHVKEIYAIAVSPDGQLVSSAGNRGEDILIHNLKTNKHVLSLNNTLGVIYSLEFSPDGQTLAVAGINNNIQLWDLKSKKILKTFSSQTKIIIDLVFSNDGHYLFSSGSDQKTQIWDVGSGRNLMSLIGFNDSSWAVFDQKGRYDASNGGDISGLHWVIGRETIKLSQLKQRYYEPSLLAKVVDNNSEPIKNVDSFNAPRLYPKVITSWSGEKNKIINIQLTDQGGGIGRVVILVNNKEVSSDARAFAQSSSDHSMTIKYDLYEHPFLIPGEENTVEVFAYNDENYLSSRGVGVIFTPDKIDQDMTPTLWAVVAGISDYQGTRIDLRYAAKDAVDFNKALTLGAKKLFGAERVNIKLLTTTTADGSIQPTKEAFVQAFEQLKEAKPWDILVIYLAGHGLSIKDDYYYLTAEAGSVDLTDPEIVKHLMISGNELTHWLKSTPIQKQVMLLDTCAAGSLANSFSETREISSGQIRAIEQMKDRTGLHVLMGSAANSVSYEASQFEQGLMTYALLQGIKGAALKKEIEIDVSELIHYAADTVPELAMEIGGIQRPRIASPGFSESFTIGLIERQDRASVPLSIKKSILLKPAFMNKETLVDDLNLSEYLRAYFREQNYYKQKQSNTLNQNITYMDVDVFPEAITARGIYQYTDTSLQVQLSLGRNRKKINNKKIIVNLSGGRDISPEVLAEKIGSEIYRQINLKRGNLSTL